MKIKNGFVLREMMGEYLVIAEGVEQVDFRKLINLNSTAAGLFEALQKQGDFTRGDAAGWLTEHYEVDEATAAADAGKIVDTWIEIGMIEA